MFALPSSAVLKPAQAGLVIFSNDTTTFSNYQLLFTLLGFNKTFFLAKTWKL
jgi:hypothetical protein